MKYILIAFAVFCGFLQLSAQNNIVYGAGISYTNGAPSFTPPARTSRVAIDTVTGKWYHFNTPGGWQLLGNTIEEIAGCSAPAYTPTKGDSKVVINACTNPEVYFWTGSAWVWINEGTTYFAGEGIRIENDTIILDSLELNELHDVFVPNPINNQVLTWDNINKRWEAKTVADSSSTNELQTLSVAANTATLSNSGGSVTIAGAGINTVGTAGTTITVTGTEVDGSITNELQTISTGTNTLTLSNGGGTVTVDTDPTNDVTGSGAAGQVSFWTGTQTQSGSAGLTFDNNLRNIELTAPSTRDPYFRVIGGSVDFRLQTFGAFGYANFGTYSNHPYFIFANNGPVARFSADGRFTLASAFPSNWATSERMQVNGSVRFTETTYLSTQSGFNTIVGSYSTPSARLHVVGGGATSSTWTAQFHNSAGNNNALMIRDDGNIGVRTNAPTDLIDINGTNGYSQLRLRTTYTPTGTADANGNTGDVAWDANYIYIKTAAGWKRSALSTF